MQNSHDKNHGAPTSWRPWRLHVAVIVLTSGLGSIPTMAQNYASPNATREKTTSTIDAGWSCYTSDRSDRTIRLCSPIIRASDTPTKTLLFALNKRAKAWIVSDELWAAVADYSKVVELSNDISTAIFERAKLYNALGEYHLAQKDYSQVIARDEKNVSAYCNRGLAKLKLKQHQQAIKDYTAALAIDPRRLDCVVGRGDVYADLGNHHQALAEYGAAIATNERYWEAYFQRAALYKKRGEKNLAIADYFKVLKLNVLSVRAAKSLRALGVIH